ncbi:MAG: gliding motility-associated C-terminal domain-containing protein [Flavobacteriales bacterium]|nr:gliding motility-associated C-terminal domain-containing protein [Flavobacteriales bacterium]
MLTITIITLVSLVALMYVDIESDVQSFGVYRLDPSTGMFDSLGVEPLVNSEFVFRDENVNTSESSYYYKLVVFNACGHNVDSSNIVQTIKLEAEGQEDISSSLSWNAFRGWDNGVSEYVIYLGIDSVFDGSSVEIVSGETLKYQDYIPNDANGYGRFCYYVEAIGYSNGLDEFAGVSRSNVSCANQEVLFDTIANVFDPTSEIYVNRTFGPIASFIFNEGYQFFIFNRWGELIFETKDPYEKWTGKYKGSLCPSSVYAYLIYYRSASGESRHKKGTVTLVYLNSSY